MGRKKKTKKKKEIEKENADIVIEDTKEDEPLVVENVKEDEQLVVEGIKEDDLLVVVDEDLESLIDTSDRPKGAPHPHECICEYQTKHAYIYKLKNHKKVVIEK